MSTSAETISLDVRLNRRGLAFTAVLIIASTAFGAIVPTLRSTRLQAADTLRQQGAAAGALPGRWSQTLVALQIALTATLLVGAALFVRNLNGIVSREAGFDRRGVLVISTDANAAGYSGERLRAFYETLAHRLSAAAVGVQSVSLSQYPPISDQMGSWTQTIGVDGGVLQADLSGDRTVYFNAVSPAYFQTIGMRLLQGRDFTASDAWAAARVAIVNESLARSVFPGQNPVGHRISIGRAAARRDLDIVGLVADSKYQRLQEPSRRIAYVPFAQVADLLAGQNLVAELRVDDVEHGRAEAVRAVRDVDPIVPVRVESIDDRIRESLVRERVLATLASALGLMALVLACAAVYGLLSYTVARRTSEFGVRVALGASRGDVAALVLVGSAPVVGTGLAAGLLLAAGLGRYVRTLLFDLQPLDPASFAAAAIIVLTLTAAAALLPARRAATIDPVVALRTE
jgi:predicted permease